MVQLLIWIIPPVLYFLAVLLFRKNVSYPHIPRIAYWGTVAMFIPIFGLLSVCTLFIVSILAMTFGDIDFKEDSKFSKKWLD
jgi:hypothetical protein